MGSVAPVRLYAATFIAGLIVVLIGSGLESNYILAGGAGLMTLGVFIGLPVTSERTPAERW